METPRAKLIEQIFPAQVPRRLIVWSITARRTSHPGVCSKPKDLATFLVLALS